MTIEERIIELNTEVIKRLEQLRSLGQDPTRWWHLRNALDYAKMIEAHVIKLIG